MGLVLFGGQAASGLPAPELAGALHRPAPPPPRRPAGFVQRREVWVALFAPLWATLFINFGLGPVVTRTSDVLPVAANVAAFAVAATLVAQSPAIGKGLGLTVDEPPEA